MPFRQSDANTHAEQGRREADLDETLQTLQNGRILLRLVEYTSREHLSAIGLADSMFDIELC